MDTPGTVLFLLCWKWTRKVNLDILCVSYGQTIGLSNQVQSLFFFVSYGLMRLTRYSPMCVVCRIDSPGIVRCLLCVIWTHQVQSDVCCVSFGHLYLSCGHTSTVRCSLCVIWTQQVHSDVCCVSYGHTRYSQNSDVSCVPWTHKAQSEFFVCHKDTSVPNCGKWQTNNKPELFRGKFCAKNIAFPEPFKKGNRARTACFPPSCSNCILNLWNFTVVNDLAFVSLTSANIKEKETQFSRAHRRKNRENMDLKFKMLCFRSKLWESGAYWWHWDTPGQEQKS